MTAYANNNNSVQGKKYYPKGIIPVLSRSFGSWRFSVELRAFGILELVEPSQALFEIQRVLKPGDLLFLCCTQQSLPGRRIQVKWRTDSVKDVTDRQWLDQYAFEEIKCLPVNRRSRLHNFNVACKARNSFAANLAA